MLSLSNSAFGGLIYLNMLIDYHPYANTQLFNSLSKKAVVFLFVVVLFVVELKSYFNIKAFILTNRVCMHHNDLMFCSLANCSSQKQTRLLNICF